MTAIRVVILCLAAALICAMLRTSRPEMATVISLAVGLAALLFTGQAFSEIAGGLQQFAALAALESGTAAVVVKAAGITVISELGVQICNDAKETALAGRIRLAARIVMLGMAMPIAMEIVSSVSSVLS